MADFGFGVHELHDLSEVASNGKLGIASFRYLQVPDSYSLWIDEGPPAPAGSPQDPALIRRVLARLRQQHQHGPPRGRREAEAILSAGFHDGAGQPLFRWSPAGELPWCGGKVGCALFPVNADPNIADPQFPLNKARVDWGDEARASYQQHALDGEFVDGVQASSFRFLLDQRRSHAATATQPLTFNGQGAAVGIPSLFATSAFVDWLAADVHGRGKLMMGNTLFEDVPWAGHVFDYLGTEINWLPGGRFQPDDDARMSYRRAMSGARPYGLLMNTNFTGLAAAEGGRGVERYFQIALFYGFYPSFFSPDAASSPYWEDPGHYDRDRPLFRKYVPIIRRLSAAGWQPLTLAASSDSEVALERFGRWPELYFTVRNLRAQPVKVTLTLESALALPETARWAAPLVASGGRAKILATRNNRTVTITLDPLAVEALRIEE